MLCAGSLRDWANSSVADWQQRIAVVAQAVKTGGAAWVTIIPATASPDTASPDTVHPDTVSPSPADHVRSLLVDSCGGVHYAERVVVLAAGVTVIVDLNSDGKQRLVDAATRVAQVTKINEDRLAAALSAPAPAEPDLVIILGPPDTMPQSLVWELAYAEIVFFDTPWHDLDAEHLEMAINDYTRRDRRFGGVDS